ncbi:hypothetical protein LCL95_11665 [Bacillus timonensis]|nr:hypothetical protein [Bacillus timonensis]
MTVVHSILYLFLYFPEDKSEYIPAFITSVIFLLGAVLAMRFFIKISKKEQQQAQELEERLKNKE